jgi:recombination protein RecR
MNSLPPSLKNISLFLQRLPGIGEKTANRLSFYLLRLPQPELVRLSEAISRLKEKTKLCSSCFNFTEDNVCAICSDKKRDHSQITVVESVLDLLSFEQGGIYNGVYHVLHGRIDPLENIGPEDIYINQLITRIKTAFVKASAVKEIILATNPDMEGEATAMYIKNKIKDQKSKIKITRLGYGLPIGANLEYADYMTLRKALENRNNF